MKKIFLTLFLGLVLINSSFSQIKFFDDQTGYSTFGLAPDPMKYNSFSLPAKPATLDSTVANTWEYSNFSDIGRGFYSSSRWTSGTGTASDHLILKVPISLIGTTQPFLKFDHMMLENNGIIEVKVVTSVATAGDPVISDFNSATALWTSGTLETAWAPTPEISLASFASSSTVYIAIIHRSTAANFVGVRNILVKGKVNQDIETVTHSLDTALETIDWNTTSIEQYKMLAIQDTSKSIHITVRNAGTAPITSIILTHDITPGPTYSDTLTGLNIAPGATYTHTHSKKTSFNGDANDLYVYRVWANLLTDSIANNDTSASRFVVIQTPFAISSSNSFKLGFETPNGDFADFARTLKCRFERVNFNATDTVKLFAPRTFTAGSGIKTQAVASGDACLAIFPISVSGTATATPTRQYIMFPPIAFETGKRYLVKFKANTIGDSTIITFRTSANGTQTSASMTNIVSATTPRVGTPVAAPLEFSRALTFVGTGAPIYLTMEYRGTWYGFFDDIEILEQTAPVANFNVTTDDAGNIDYDSLVSVINTSIGEGATYSWNFGDPAAGSLNTSVLQSPPPFRYTKPGNYTITLTVTNSAGTNTKTIQIEVKELAEPVANFTTTITGLKVKFVNTSTPNITSPALIATTYEWVFGDNSPIQTPRTPADKTYAKGGKYTICLKAKNRTGENETCKDITLQGASISSNNLSDQISIYPNPVSTGTLHIDNNSSNVINVKMVDLLGKSNFNQSVNRNAIINLDNVSNGIYFVEIESKGERTIKKIVVDKQ
jgi:PKD repeat protein